MNKDFSTSRRLKQIGIKLPPERPERLTGTPTVANMSGLVSKLSQLNPFSKDDESDDDYGEEIDDTTVAGGGHGASDAEAHKGELRVSEALKAFMVSENILSEDEVGLGGDATTDALVAFLCRPHIQVPAHVKDMSYSLPEYFVSSSHNTYLLAHQLYGKSAATAYETALRTGSRCVEIDAWDNDDNEDEPKVTHGFTLVSSISFRAVCNTIRDVLVREKEAGGAAPILISLENHCSPHGQRRMVEIMKEVFGDLLLDQTVPIEGLSEASHPPLAALQSKVVVMVEYHLPEEADSESDSSDSESGSDDDEEEKQGREEYKRKKEEAGPSIIIPELAALGVYAQSVKPKDNSWYDPGILADGPHHHLINVSETQLSTHLPAHGAEIAVHNSKHLMRVYPKGTRISSKNLNPVPFWGLGAQVCAMNWQTFGRSMQLNDALFSGTDGYVLKPAALRAGGNGTLTRAGVKKTLRLRVAGATDVPVPAGRGADDPIYPYLTCTLHHPDQLSGKPPKRKTDAYEPRESAFSSKTAWAKSPPEEPVWDQLLEWEYDDNDLVFLRMLLKSDDGLSKNKTLCVAAERVAYLVSGWSFVRMLDLHGHESTCSILVWFDFGAG